MPSFLLVENIAAKEKQSDYQRRVADWIGNQGILFQLRYARTIGAGSLIKQFGRLFVRLVVLLAVFVGIGYFLVERHFKSAGYSEGISSQIQNSMGLASIDGDGFSKSRGFGGYRDLDMEGGDSTFFYAGKLEQVSIPFEYLTGITGRWNPDSLKAATAEINLKAGGTTEEMSEALSGVLESLEGKGITRISIPDFSCDWGYSKVTYGRISNTNFKADLEDGNWKILLKGGEFQQNWLKGFKIESGELVVSRSGILVKSLSLTSEIGSLNLAGEIGGPLERPQFNLKGDFESLSVAKILKFEGADTRDFVGGTISGDLKISGSTNQSIRIEGNGRLSNLDSVVIRERWTILRAISIIDTTRTYRRVSFDSGSFKFVSENGELKIDDLSLSAQGIAKLTGGFTTRLPSQAEAAEELNIKLTENFSSDATDTSSAQKMEDERMSLSDAIGRGTRVDDLNLDRSSNYVPSSRDGNLQMSQSELDEARLRVEMNVHRISGNLRLAVPASSFEGNKNLAERYPIDEDGWRWIEIPIKDSSFEEISSKASEKLLGQGRHRSVDDSDQDEAPQ